MPGLVALCMVPLIAAVDVSPMDQAMGEPWPLELAADPTDVDVAMLQLRANVTLARLIESGERAE